MSAPTGGAGRPEGNYFMERLIDTAARETGVDRLELRRCNFIKPKDIPFAAASDQTYDSGDFPAVFRHVPSRRRVPGKLSPRSCWKLQLSYSEIDHTASERNSCL